MEPIEATGLIKHVSLFKKIPCGKIRVLSPMGLRGLEVEFLTQNVNIPQNDRCLLESGMTLRFHIKGDSRNGFTANELRPVENAEYNGSVIKVPSSTDPTSRTVVSLDLTLDPVVISNESLKNVTLSQPLKCGDYVRLTIRWTDWIKAQHAMKRPEFDIVGVLERSTPRPRSRSQGREGKVGEHGSTIIRVSDGTSSEELSPQHERLMRQREVCQKAPRRRSKSVGNTLQLEAETMPQRCSPYVPPYRYPYQYPMVAPEMMYGSFANFYNQPSAWMAPNFMYPYAQRGAQ